MFDALFSLLEEKSIPRVETLVYDAIVHVVGLLTDSKRVSNVEAVRPLLDFYIEKHMTSNTAHGPLMNCLKSIFENEDKTHLPQMISSLKAIRYLFKFIVVSKLRSNNEDNNFQIEIEDVFSALSKLLQQSAPEYRGAQANAIKNLSNSFIDLSPLFEPREMAEMVKHFVTSVYYEASLVFLNIEKFVFLRKFVASNLFYHPSNFWFFI